MQIPLLLLHYLVRLHVPLPALPALQGGQPTLGLVETPLVLVQLRLRVLHRFLGIAGELRKPVGRGRLLMRQAPARGTWLDRRRPAPRLCRRAVGSELQRVVLREHKLARIGVGDQGAAPAAALLLLLRALRRSIEALDLRAQELAQLLLQVRRAGGSDRQRVSGRVIVEHLHHRVAAMPSRGQVLARRARRGCGGAPPRAFTGFWRHTGTLLCGAAASRRRRPGGSG